MKLLTTVQPLQAAIAKIDAKTPVGSVLRTAEWQQVPLALRERAQFSAGVESMRVMQTIQAKLTSAIGLKKEQVARGEAFVDRSSFIGDLRKVVEEEGLGTGTGSLTDLSSRRRLGLIYDTQIQQAQNFARWKMDTNPDILDAYPAQELIRVERRQVPRDWSTRWLDAGGTMFGSRMVALKTDPIWSAISVFGVPWPPFDFGSGMGLRDVDRKDAEELGLLAPGEEIPAIQEQQFNADLFASVADMAPALVDALKRIFGNQISISDGIATWIGKALS